MYTDTVQVQTDTPSFLNLSGFNAAELNTTPYEYLLMPGFIRAEAVSGLSRDFPEINRAGSFPVDTMQCGTAFRALMRELEGPAFRHAVEQKFGVDLSGRPTMITVRGRTDETDGRIHTDSKTKIITVLIYFNESWQDNGGRLRILRSGTDLEDFVAEIEPAMGTLLAFRRSDNSWHGHKPFVGARRTLQLNWVVSEAVRRREQNRHGVSAFFKGLFGNSGYTG